MTTRTKILKDLLSVHHIDALLISNHYNILYLTGFHGLSPEEREAWVLATRNNVYLFTDARYSHFHSNNITVIEITPEKPLREHLKEIAIKEYISSSGCESDDLRMNEYEILQKFLPSLKGFPHIFREQRTIKSIEEISLIKRACEYTDQCFKDIVKEIRSGLTEREIAFKIETWIRSHHFDTAFYPIVAVNEHAAIPHFNTKTDGNKKVEKHSHILIDFGIRYKNYCSDMTRMICVGEPSNEYVNVYKALFAVQEKAIQLLLPHASYADIDTQTRKTIQEKGYPLIPHSLGHGVGLEIHEYPKISHSGTDYVKNGHVITIEPGIYLPGKFGIRIEDTVAIENGEAIVLTKTPKALLNI